MGKIEILPLELRKLGLTEKEARVYLAALELGHTSAQQIAKKAKISRPTAYEIIKSLENKELLTESKERGKRYFIAQSPDHLLGILRRQKRELEEKERELIRIIATLRDKYYLNNKKEIKTFQGKTGLGILLDDFLTTHAKKIHVLVGDNKIWPVNQRKVAYEKIKKRLGRIEIKEVSSNNFKGIVIAYDKVIILTPQKTGLLIENKIVVSLIKSLFLLLRQ